MPLRGMFLQELAQMYDSEEELGSRLPMQRQMVTNAKLRHLVDLQIFETSRHLQRIEEVFAAFKHPVKRQPGQILKALFNRVESTMSHSRANMQAALFACFHRLQHYKSATYACLRDWSALLENDLATHLLEENLQDSRALANAFENLARNEKSLSSEGLNISPRERIVPLSKVLTKREQEVLRWLAEGIFRPQEIRLSYPPPEEFDVSILVSSSPMEAGLPTFAR
jgi:ferritin-like metal-binding protein YciE